MEHTTMKLTAREVDLLLMALNHPIADGLHSDAGVRDADKLYKRLDRARRRLAGELVPVSAPPAPTGDLPGDERCPGCGRLRLPADATQPHRSDCPLVKPEPELLDCGCPAQLVADAGHQEGCAELEPTPDLDRLTTEAKSLAERFADTNALCVAELLRADGTGFTRADHSPRIIEHPKSGVTISCQPSGIRITFYAPDAPHGSGIIDLPAGTAYGVVTQIATALHAQAMVGE